MYNCIIPWSGGVESTALVYDCLQRGLNPYCFHLTVNGHWKRQVEAVRTLANLLDVRVDVIEYNNPRRILNRQATTDHYSQFWQGGTPPMFFIWTNMAHLIQVDNPQIPRIYYGYNGGIIDRNDEQGDKHTEWVDDHFRHIERNCAMLGIQTKMSAPLGHMSKLEQWELLPEQVQEHVHTCVHPTDRSCGKCVKCNEMEYMLSAL